MHRLVYRVSLAIAFYFSLSVGWAESEVSVNGNPIRIPATGLEQAGSVPAQANLEDKLVLSIEDKEHIAFIHMDFDLEYVPHLMTPLARLQIEDLMSMKRENRGKTLGALHVFVGHSADRTAELAGSTVVRPAGIPFSYTIDITGAVNNVLKSPEGKRKLHLALRLEGEPTFATVYTMPTITTEKSPVTLEIVSPVGWTHDWKERMTPVTQGPVVYRESCFPLAANRDKDLIIRLLYPAKKIIEVIRSSTGEKLQEGRDWILKNGRLALPVGSQAPIQIESEFFTFQKEDKEGNIRTIHSKIRLEEGTWYHERQLEVSYEPAARDWSFPMPVSKLDNLPRLKRLLTKKAPVKIVLFGDSISFGANASKLTGIWPYQPSYGELVAWKLEQHYGSQVTFMNHSRGGATSSYAVEQAESLVGHFRPDLAIIAFGMNDRAPARREVFLSNLEKAVSMIRAMSPDTEFIIVTPMMNNPDQSTGSEPVFAVRDDALKLSGFGMAFVDITTTQKEMLLRKNYLDLSGNGANHPNDFLHRVYAQRICEVLIR